MAALVEKSKLRVAWLALITLVFLVTTIYLLRDAFLTSAVGNRLLDGFLAILVVSGIPTTFRRLRAELAAFRSSRP